MSFVLKNQNGADYFNDELGFGLLAGEEKDVVSEGLFMPDALAISSTLQADLIAGTIQRLDALGGNVIPPALAFDDLSVSTHQQDLTAHGLAISTLAQINDAGSGQIIDGAERSKLAAIEAGAEVNDSGAEIITKLNAEAQPVSLDVSALDGSSAAQIRDRATHTGTQLSSTISDFNASADARISAQKNQANGIAGLDASGNVPLAQLNNLPPSFTPKGNWDAATNTPALASGVGNEGDFYIVSVAGTTNLDGVSSWSVGDNAYFASSQWHKTDNSDSVTSVNTKTGAVVLDTDDVSEGVSNLYFTDARVAASASVAANTAKISADGSINTHIDVNTAGATQGQALLLNAGVWEAGDLAGTSPQPVVQARLGADFPLSTGVWLPIPFNIGDEETDAASLSNTAGSFDKIFVHDVSAPIELVAWVPWDATTSDSMSIRIRKNDSIVVPGTLATVITFDDFSPICVVVKVPRSFMAAGDFFRVEMIQNVGAVSVLAGATFQATQLKGVKGIKGDAGAGSTISIDDNGSAVGVFDTIDFGIGLSAVDQGAGKALVSTTSEIVYLGKNTSQDFSGAAICSFDDVIKNVGSFSVVGGRITCQFDGEVEVSFDISIDDLSNGRESSRVVLLKNGVDVSHTSRFGYHRNNANGENSMTLSSVQSVVANGDFFEVQMNVLTAPATLRALANGCIFKVKRTA